MDSAITRGMQNRDGAEDRTDSDLVELCQQGESDAFTELVARHHKAALKVAISILRDRQDARTKSRMRFGKLTNILRNFSGKQNFRLG